jgi:SpoU rRNA methylase family enzyme
MTLPRREPTTEHDRIVLTYDHAALTADLTVKLLDIPSLAAAFRVDKVAYINPTGLAASGTDFFEISVKNGATVVAGPLSSAVSPIAADTFTDLTLSATDANRVLDPGEILSVLFDETGTQTLPAGRIVIYGRFI